VAAAFGIRALKTQTPPAPVPPAQVRTPVTGKTPAPEPAAVQQPPPPVEAAKPVAMEYGFVDLAISPWGEVYVDGKKRGVSPPLNEVGLAPGRHEIEIRNGTFPVYRQRVQVKPGERVKIRHKFR
jgi:serine/threonine-protein kinase